MLAVTIILFWHRKSMPRGDTSQREGSLTQIGRRMIAQLSSISKWHQRKWGSRHKYRISRFPKRSYILVLFLQNSTQKNVSIHDLWEDMTRLSVVSTCYFISYFLTSKCIRQTRITVWNSPHPHRFYLVTFRSEGEGENKSTLCQWLYSIYRLIGIWDPDSFSHFVPFHLKVILTTVSGLPVAKWNKTKTEGAKCQWDMETRKRSSWW